VLGLEEAAKNLTSVRCIKLVKRRVANGDLVRLQPSKRVLDMFLMRQETENHVHDRILNEGFFLQQLDQNFKKSLLLLSGNVYWKIVIDESRKRHKPSGDDLLHGFVDQLLLNKFHVLERSDALVDDQNPQIPPNSSAS